MTQISLQEGKNYLRVDSNYDDSLIETLLASAEALCCDIAKLTEDEWEAICAEEKSQKRDLMRAAIFYTLGYLYEHREEADHHDLVITLRSILFALREDKLL